MGFPLATVCLAPFCRASEGRGSPRGRAENPLLGLIVPRRVCRGCAGHIYPGATHRQRPPGFYPHPTGPLGEAGARGEIVVT